MPHPSQDPHAGRPLKTLGPAPADARLTLVLLHGRGASADDILGLAREVAPADVACLAPDAAGHTWYPLPFLAPMDQNEPWLSSALGTIERLMASLAGQGVPADRVALGGFSQGACLSLEFAARHARRYAAILGLSGGLIGPPGTPRAYAGSFDGTPVFLGCSDVDAHIPLTRVQETADVFRSMAAQVDARIYRGMAHTINEDELGVVRAMLGGG